MCLCSCIKGLLKRNKTRRQVIIERDDSVTVRIPKSDPLIKIITAYTQHIGTREYQQDSLYVSDSTTYVKGTGAVSFGVLCDGMGGLADGGATSSTVVDIFSKALPSVNITDNIPSFLEQQVLYADQYIYQQSLIKGIPDSGTTLVAVVIIDNNLYWCSVGDSRLYIFRKGEIICVTRDHNYLLNLKEMVKRGEITREAASTHPKKEALISYIGSGDVEIIDVIPSPFLLEHGDVVLLCSDGLTKSLNDVEIKDIIFNNIDSISEAARLLSLVAYDKNNLSKDNISVALIQYLE